MVFCSHGFGGHSISSAGQVPGHSTPYWGGYLLLGLTLLGALLSAISGKPIRRRNQRGERLGKVAIFAEAIFVALAILATMRES